MARGSLELSDFQACELACQQDITYVPCDSQKNKLKKPLIVLKGTENYSAPVFFGSPGKGEDKEYPTIGARLIRLEEKVVTLPLLLILLSLQQVTATC